MRFSVGTNTAGDPSWWLFRGNRKVAREGETFASWQNARRAGTWFKLGAKTARYEIYEDAGGTWRGRAWRSSLNRSQPPANPSTVSPMLAGPGTTFITTTGRAHPGRDSRRPIARAL